MRTFLILVFACMGGLAIGQDEDQNLYDSFVNDARAHYEAEDFAASAKLYSAAFESLGWTGSVRDHYNAAVSWALANVPDSAFSQLFQIAVRMSDFQDLDLITQDAGLVSLHTDPRWDRVITEVKANKDQAEANWDRPLAHTLDSILDQDQRYRQQTNEVEKQYVLVSGEMQPLWRILARVDSTNLALVSKILDERGWLGPDIIGQKGNVALFLVIQHADIATQQRYLPMMREAAAKGNVNPADLALLEDRMAIRQGKRQIYGSQIGRDKDTGEYYVGPLEDPDHVDERRASVGLGPMADYLANWDIIWDVAAYKADLPAIEAKERAKKIKE